MWAAGVFWGGRTSPPKNSSGSHEMVRPLKFLQEIRICTTIMGKIRKNRYLARFYKKIFKNLHFCYFLDHYFGWISGFQKNRNFRALNGASLQNGLVLANQNRFFLQIFFKRKITIHPSTTETFPPFFRFAATWGRVLWRVKSSSWQDSCQIDIGFSKTPPPWQK